MYEILTLKTLLVNSNFNVGFSVQNNGESAVENLKITVSQFEYIPRFEGFASSGEAVQTAYAIDFDVSGCRRAQFMLTKENIQR
jgi:hypothetical protein